MANTRANKNANQNKNNKPQRIVRNFYLNGGNSTSTKEYNRNSLLDILEGIPFRQISIPIYLHRGYLGNDQDRGYLNVGYVLNYTPEEEKFSIVVKDKYVELIDGLGEAIIYVRAVVDKDSNVRNIIALDIEAVYDEEEENSEDETTEDEEAESSEE